MDIKQQTQNVAAQGRYGDSMLLHVNPAEVQGLASIMPLTKNPETGQPEAFLPFLAPLLGSMAGTALFTGLSAPVAGAIGSGIASAIQSGDLKQGIISGITGFGLGKAFGAAGIGEAGRAASDAATTGAEVVADVAADTFGQGATGGMGALTGTEVVGSAAADTFGQGATGGFGALSGPVTPTVGSTADAVAKGGLDAFASQLAKPSSYIPIALGEGTTGTIQAQEDFEKAMREYELGQQKRQEEIMAMYPEQIPMSSPYFYSKEGGVVNMEEGRKIPDEERSVSFLPGKGRLKKDNKAPINRLMKERQEEKELPPLSSFEAAMSGGLDAYYTPPKQLSGPITAESVPLIDPTTGAPMIDPNTGMPIPSGQFKPSANYRPGIDPEFNYLPGGNRPASFLGSYLNQTGEAGGAGGADGNEQAALSNYYFNMMNPTGNPFAMMNPIGSPFGMMNFTNQELINRNPINIFEQDLPINFPINDFRTPPRFSVDRENEDIINMNNNMMDINMPVFEPSIANRTPEPLFIPPMREVPPEDFGFGPGVRRSEDFFEPENLMMSSPVTPPVISTVTPPVTTPSVIPPIIPNPVQSVITPQPIAQTPRPVQEPVEMTTITTPNLLGEMQTVNPSGPVASPTNIGMQIPDTPIGGISAVQNPFIQLPMSPLTNDFMSIERLNNLPFGMEEGKQIPDDAKGLQALAKTEKGKDAVRQMGFELQAGGLTPSPDEIREVQMAILGEVPNNTQVIDMFVQKYGNEIFNMIRQQVLNSDGSAQTQGMIKGMGGGMDDLVLGMIGSQQRVAVSPGEYIVPADVVSGLGDGSSDAGAKELDNLLDRVRQERTNTTRQPKELNKGKVLPK